jgi:hypothetical protein
MFRATIDSAHLSSGNPEYLRIVLTPSSHRMPEIIINPASDKMTLLGQATSFGEIVAFIAQTRFPAIEFDPSGLSVDGTGKFLDKIEAANFTKEERSV